MNDYQVKQCHEAMLKFLRKQGDDKMNGILRSADDECKRQKADYIEEERQRIIQDYKNRLAQDEIKLKIQRSATENVARITKMGTINSLIEKLYKDAKGKLVARQQSDTAAYRELLRNLIVQGLIKLMEVEVHIRCRKSDLKYVQEVYEEASEEYKALMKSEVKIF